MVLRLTDFLKTDDIAPEVLATIDPELEVQQQIEELKELVESLAQTVKNSVVVPNTNEPSVTVANDSRTVNNDITLPSDSMSAHQQPISLSDAPTGTIMRRNRFSVQYDPSNDKSVSAEQFVIHVESAAEAYEFESKSLLLAVYSRLKGVARMWLDGRKTLFTTWFGFKMALLEEFGQELNEAEVSSKMLATTRRNDEKPIDYNFRMLALGNRLGLSEPAIVKYTREGLRHREMQTAMATTTFMTMKSMRLAILEYEQNIPSIIRRKPDSSEMKPFGNRPSTRNDIKQENIEKLLVCYNCNEKGHFSRDCPKPQRKERCATCQKTNHKTKDCYRNPNTTNRNNINKIGDHDGTYNDVVKLVEIEGKTYKAFLDSGSASSLIRERKAEQMSNIEPCQKTLTGCVGGRFLSVRMVRADVQIDGKIMGTNLFVVHDADIPEDILLGRDILCRKGHKFIIGDEKCRVENMVASIEIVNNRVVENEKHEWTNLLDENKQCFAEKVAELGKCTSVKMEIMLKTAEPVNMKPYRIAFAKREIVSDILKELLEFEIIRPSRSIYASPVVLVEKKNAEHRLCVDYRKLNSITIKTPFAMPILEEQFSQLSGNTYFTSLDLRMGYYQIEMEEASKQFTAFITTDGHYEFNRMPFGLVNAPSVFQRLMNSLISQMNRGEALAYLDDIIIPSQTIEQGMTRLAKFFKLLTTHGLTLRREKCKFFKLEIEYLGHIINKDGVKPGRAKVAAIKDFPIPTNITEVRRYLGLTGFFRKFVLDYAIITKPITKLLGQTERDKFKRTSVQQEAFECLKAKLTTAPLLVLYDSSQYHEVHTDACAIGLAGILLQSPDEKSWRPVMYFSRHCTEAEQRYHSYELECLAVVETLERFRLYLLGKYFRVVTDCAAIALTKEHRELKARIARWWMKIQEYNMDIVHRAGSRLAHVDALSRAPVDPQINTEPAGFIYTLVTEPTDWVAAM